MALDSDIILAVLWQFEGLARPSVVLPLRAVFLFRIVSRQILRLAGFTLKKCIRITP
jgi:hypothetical protein